MRFRVLLAFWVVVACALSANALRFSKEGPRNFGILMHTPKHTLYRSAALGESGLREVADYLRKKNLPFPKTIIHMNIQGYSRSLISPTMFAIEEFEAQEKYGFHFFHSFDYNASTYLTGTDPYRAHKNVNRKNHLSQSARNLFGFKPEMEILGGLDAFYRILDLVLTSEGPVLFHCTGGQHRTGMIAMAIRYLQGGEWVQGEYRVTGRGVLNAAQYEYYLHNPVRFKSENIGFIERWSKDPVFAEYVERYRSQLD